MGKMAFMIKITNKSAFVYAITRLYALLLTTSLKLSLSYLRDILYISAKVKPGWKTLKDYIKEVPALPDTAPVKDFISEIKLRNKNNASGEILFPGTFDCRIIKSERIKMFQSEIIARVFRAWFGVECTNTDLEILSAYGNVSWLIENLFHASGVKRRRTVVLDNNTLRRIKTVYRVYISSLALYLKLEETDVTGKGSPSHAGLALWIKRFFKKYKQKGVVTKNIYPREIEIQSLKMEKASLFSYKIEAEQKIKVGAEYTGFSKYLKAQSLIPLGKVKKKETLEKIIKKMELFH